MFESLAYIPNFIDQYSTELSAIEAASERAAGTVERESAKLTRGDGTPVYTPPEHAERLQAILEAVGATYDAATARYLQQSEREVSELEKKLARLAGADPFDTL